MEFITADHHFGHKNIIKYCNRPFENVREMDAVMIERWNKVVGQNDIVYHLGDFALAPKSYIRHLLNNLNGYKILIRGNHDRTATQMLRLGFDEVYEGIYIKDDIILTHNPIHLNGFTILNVGVDAWNYTPIPFPSVQYIILCGHIHDKWLVVR